jgi:hypothetical protein
VSLRDEITAQSDQNVFCRTGHAFPQRPTRAYYVGNGRAQAVRLVYRCKCGAWKRGTVRRSTGEILERFTIDYSDTDAYLMPGHGRIDRSEFRRSQLTRIDIEKAPPDNDD